MYTRVRGWASGVLTVWNLGGEKAVSALNMCAADSVCLLKWSGRSVVPCPRKWAYSRKHTESKDRPLPTRKGELQSQSNTSGINGCAATVRSPPKRLGDSGGRAGAMKPRNTPADA